MKRKGAKVEGERQASNSSIPQSAIRIPQSFGLPHREPFLFVDEVLDVDPGVSAHGVKTFTGNEPLFAGHFPGNPLVPGVILTEALAQMAGIAGGGDQRAFLLSAIRSMKFPASARPNERIELAAEKTGVMGGLWMFAVRAAVGKRLVAEGQIVLNETPS